MKYAGSNQPIRRFDKEVTLLTQALGKGGRNEIINEMTVLCDTRGVYSNEFYTASSHGMKPELTFILHAFEYNGEDLLEYRGRHFKVIRVFHNDYDEVELTAESTRGPGK